MVCLLEGEGGRGRGRVEEEEGERTEPCRARRPKREERTYVPWMMRVCRTNKQGGVSEIGSGEGAGKR